MQPILLSGVGVFLAGGVLFLLVFKWFDSNRKQKIKNIASAFVGEIVAILHTIELHSIENKLKQAAIRPTDILSLENFTFPRFLIYEAEVNRLDAFEAPLPRKITSFYTSLQSLQDDIRQLGYKTPSELPQEESLVQSLLMELQEDLNLADSILKDLRSILSDDNMKQLI
jgi:hypothetical protein